MNKKHTFTICVLFAILGLIAGHLITQETENREARTIACDDYPELCPNDE